MSLISKGRQEASQTNSVNVQSLPYWSIITAYGLAAAEGIKLHDEHFKVINHLRKKYRNSRPADTKVQIFNQLEVSFSAHGGRNFLYRLFPKDPVNQSMRIAGLN